MRGTTKNSIAQAFHSIIEEPAEDIVIDNKSKDELKAKNAKHAYKT